MGCVELGEGCGERRATRASFIFFFIAPESQKHGLR